jgi:hypothetical protein
MSIVKPELQTHWQTDANRRRHAEKSELAVASVGYSVTREFAVKKNRRLRCSPSGLLKFLLCVGNQVARLVLYRYYMVETRQYLGQTQDSLAVLLSRSPYQNVQTNRCTTDGSNHRYLRYHPVLVRSVRHSLAHDQLQQPISALLGEKRKGHYAHEHDSHLDTRELFRHVFEPVLRGQDTEQLDLVYWRMSRINTHLQKRHTYREFPSP